MKLPLARTEHLTADLVAIAEKWPRQLVDFVELLENGEGFRLFRAASHGRAQEAARGL